jgi:hypothetical protein
MEYSVGRKPILVPLEYNKSTDDITDAMSRTKAEFWRYEYEYRIIEFRTMDARLRPFESNLLCGITLGMQISARDRNLMYVYAFGLPQSGYLRGRLTRGSEGSSFVLLQFNALAPSTFAPGTTSTALIIQMDAKNFKIGNGNLIDDVVGSTAAFEPASAVATPEPGTFLLLLLGFAGLAVMGHRRRPRATLLASG